jgi:hypothetical protein
MSIYIQYHNYDKEGLIQSAPDGRLGIHTRMKHVRNAVGDQVYLIFGIGNSRQYYLWETFTVDKVKDVGHDDFHANGTGWQLIPPPRLKGQKFEAFRKSCANFVGFRKVDDLPFSSTLKPLAEQHRKPKSKSAIQSFLRELSDLLENDSDRDELAEHLAMIVKQPAKPQPSKSPTRALSIRQPHAEAIMREVKKIEYRSGPTKIRERIYIYASLARYSAKSESQMMAEYKIDDLACDDLPRGVIIGTVELHACKGGDWHLRAPERAKCFRKPKGQPQPVWFKPF